MQGNRKGLDVLLGLQWGDEGKGKIVDVLAGEYDVVARFQGGPNAGHSLKVGQQKVVLHTIPSGVFRPQAINVIGNGVVLDPISFAQEVENLKSMGIDCLSNVLISRKAHLILPSHRGLDAASEASKGKERIGSTLKGIGPTYMDKTGRNGLRVGDLENPNFLELYNALKRKHLRLLSQHKGTFPFEHEEEAFFKGIEIIKEFRLIDSEFFINRALDEGASVLAEGAQGTLLDIDFGSYPFVTSSSTLSAGACSGLGVAPSRIGDVYGIVKAYCTRVGAGPFPTELFDETGEKLREKGNEFGATTGRPRRCGWIDLVALRYAVMLNGVTKLILTKADVLEGFEEIRVATHYKYNGELTQEMPYSLGASVEPIYQSMPGWTGSESISDDYEALPYNLRHYIDFLERVVGVPVAIVSLGPAREETIIR